MKRLLSLLCLLSGHAMACSVTLHWTKPTTNTDGTPLTDLLGYRVLKGSTATSMVPYATITPAYAGYTDATFTGPAYYTVVAYDSAGVQSDPSNTLSILVKTCPAAPTGLASP